MTRSISRLPRPLLALVLGGASSVLAQAPALGPPRDGRPGFGRPPAMAPGEFQPDNFGPPGPGGMMRQKIKLVEQFDQDGDKRLNATERKAARDFLQKESAAGRGRRRWGGPGGRRGG